MEQVQDFTPTPMTVATVMYYSGYHPYTLNKYYTPKTKQERQNQHRFFFWYKKENKQWISDYLIKVKRPDLLKRLVDPPKAKAKNAPKWLAKQREKRPVNSKRNFDKNKKREK